MGSFIYGMVTISLLLVCSQARAEIYKCTDAEDNLIYQQTPCPKPGPAKEKEPATQNIDAREDVVGQVSEPAEAKSAEMVAQCKKKYRDAIDAIDAEIGRGYSASQGEAYRQRLRVLTEQLRAC